MTRKSLLPCKNLQDSPSWTFCEIAPWEASLWGLGCSVLPAAFCRREEILQCKRWALPHDPSPRFQIPEGIHRHLVATILIPPNSKVALLPWALERGSSLSFSAPCRHILLSSHQALLALGAGDSQTDFAPEDPSSHPPSQALWVCIQCVPVQSWGIGRRRPTSSHG